MMVFGTRNPICSRSSVGLNQITTSEVALWLDFGFSTCRNVRWQKATGFGVCTTKGTSILRVRCSHNQNGQQLPNPYAVEKKMIKKVGKKEHHLWMKRDSAGSGQKALNLVRIVAKWMLAKGQGATMGTYDTLLLAFDMDRRVDEAESLWNMILHTHTRSISKQLFSRMTSLYDHHNMQDKIIEVFADMEELGVKPDEDTVRRVARAFQKLGQEDKQKLVLKNYQCKWKYIHFKGERVRVRRDAWDE